LNADALRTGLVALGIDGVVEARGALAVLTVGGDSSALRDPAVRAAAVTLAAEHGFKNLALEVLEESRDRASLHRD
jgi:hypothetical protein